MPKLLTPVQIGAIKLAHRLVMAPSSAISAGLTPSSALAEYYARRSSDGGLVVAELSVMPLRVPAAGRRDGGHPGQLGGWSEVTRAVHARNGRIFARLSGCERLQEPAVDARGSGRRARDDLRHPHLAPERGDSRWSSESRRGFSAGTRATLDDYRELAQQASDAGFDGIELGRAFVPLNHERGSRPGQVPPEKRWLDICGSVLVESVDVTSAVFGGDRVAVQLDPRWILASPQGGGIELLVGQVASRLSGLGVAYVGVAYVDLVAERGREWASTLMTLLRRSFKGPILANGDIPLDQAEAMVERGEADLVAFAKLFDARPDLPAHLGRGASLYPERVGRSTRDDARSSALRITSAVGGT